MPVVVAVGAAVGASAMGGAITAVVGTMVADAAIASTIGSAIAGSIGGAIAGGISSAATGGDFMDGLKAGALGGAITGGISGYGLASSAAAEATPIEAGSVADTMQLTDVGGMPQASTATQLGFDTGSGLIAQPPVQPSIQQPNTLDQLMSSPAAGVQGGGGLSNLSWNDPMAAQALAAGSAPSLSALGQGNSAVASGGLGAQVAQQNAGGQLGNLFSQANAIKSGSSVFDTITRAQAATHANDAARQVAKKYNSQFSSLNNLGTSMIGQAQASRNARQARITDVLSKWGVR